MVVFHLRLALAQVLEKRSRLGESGSFVIWWDWMWGQGSSAGCGATMGIAGAAIGNGAGSTGGGGIAGAASTGGGPGDIVNRTLAGC